MTTKVDSKKEVASKKANVKKSDNSTIAETKVVEKAVKQKLEEINETVKSLHHSDDKKATKKNEKITEVKTTPIEKKNAKPYTMSRLESVIIALKKKPSTSLNDLAEKADEIYAKANNRPRNLTESQADVKRVQKVLDAMKKEGVSVSDVKIS